LSNSFLFGVFEKNRAGDAIIWKDQAYSYQWLLDRIDLWNERLAAKSIGQGVVVALEAEFSPGAVAIFLALLERGCIIVPITNAAATHRDEFRGIANAQISIALDEDDQVEISTLAGDGLHPHYDALRALEHPGLTLFTSGSTGESKAAVHDLIRLLEKFQVPRRKLRSIAFLLFDHIGGINTLFYSLSNGGCVVIAEDRSPDGVLGAVEAHRVDLLPTSPTFINLVLLSEAYARHDLSCLSTVTYGTEPMLESTLRRFHELFPHIQLQQTYGLSELGILRSKSKRSDSLWVKVGGEGFQTRIVDGILHIKADSPMLGYLNAPSPFAGDGWYDTGDSVEVDGDYVRFLGRKSEIINVGGQKVYPAEVESVILEMDGLTDVTVYGERNPIIGNIVCATVNIEDWVARRSFSEKLQDFCRNSLPDYKVPVKIKIEAGTNDPAGIKKKRPSA
jgi:long-chain acyl-CoA synthetase